MIRIVLADDERPAREGLRLRLDGREGFEVVGEAASGKAALAAVETHAPDLLFLDVRMPDLNGFEVLQRIPAARRPHVVFVTAYDRYAIRAFEMHALDYLLKPVAPKRLDEALERARTAHTQRLAARTLEALARGMRAGDDLPGADAPARPAVGGPPLDRITVRDGARYRVVPIETVRWIEACGNYVTLHTGGRGLLHRATLQEMEKRLPPRRFARIHRGAIVNVSEVAEIHPLSHGDYTVVLKDGSQLRMTRKHRDSLL